ncbi:poly(A) polymerase ['Fragaria x ananassa' phyllody phytoplasma]|uniref:Poly(A) polymerase n=1 Tax='Fragaria x ananassa' phyllody phytoplasma TaxID=2358428 RepID=A0ABS5K2Q0_9MOLU|nr:poly(A) polymerase ['Fragaria x ananassa' phyllody phytoplasma]MBS2126146.1 poly(A) polymerase ['Fragaria x ananassa' phyllody phytoplasma]
MLQLNQFSQIKIAQNIIKKLKNQGFEAFIVGGVVRDYLLNTPINSDIDLTTNALPYQIIQFFPQQKLIVSYGSMKLMIGNNTFEITTYRKEDEYQNHRHPKKLVFIKNIQEDLLRRDFTVNTLLMDEHGQIFDFASGITDLEQKILRTVKNPLVSFKEDALRIMRTFYFQAKLGFHIETNTQQALLQQSYLLTKISYQRIYEYLQKIIIYPYWHISFQNMMQTKSHFFCNSLTPTIAFFASLNSDTLKELQIETSLPESIFWSIASTFNSNIFTIYSIPKAKKKQSQLLLHLKDQITSKYKLTFNLFQYGLANCLLVAKINYLLNPSSYSSIHSFLMYIQELQTIYKNLPLKKITDLKICLKEVFAQMSYNSFILPKNFKKKLIGKVLNQQLPNQKEALMHFIINYIKK